MDGVVEDSAMTVSTGCVTVMLTFRSSQAVVSESLKSGSSRGLAGLPATGRRPRVDPRQARIRRGPPSASRHEPLFAAVRSLPGLNR